MSYPGFCEKYGENKAQLAAFFAPAAAETAIQLHHTGAIYYPLVGLAILSGIAGFVCGTIAHEIGNKIADENKMNPEKGEKTVRQIQAIAYALPVALVLNINALISGSRASPPANENIEPVIQIDENMNRSAPPLPATHPQPAVNP